VGIGFLHRVEDALVDFQAVFGEMAGKRIDFTDPDFLSGAKRQDGPEK
jgi:hypothetical protein